MNRYNGLNWHLITTFGLGHCRPASGTWGSLPPVLVAALLISLGLGPTSAPILYHLILTLILIAFAASCIIRGDEAEARWGKDPSQVVADETAGQCIPLFLVGPAVAHSPQAAILILATAFFAFRFFDILKLEPANSLQRLPSGWGVLLDDIAAGLYAAIVVWITALIITSG